MFASTEGVTTVRARAPAFIASFNRRVECGLLTGAPDSRSRYRVTRQSSSDLAFHAIDWWTAINAGLNDVEIAVASDGRVQYAIRYPRWAAFVVALGAAVGLMLIAVFFVIDIRAYIAQHPASRIGRLSMDANVAIAWGLVLFWGFVWPWMLIALHKRSLRRLMERLIAEVDASAAR